MQFKTKTNNGFTVIELLVVVMVMAILLLIVVVGYGSWHQSLTGTQLKSDLSSAGAAMESTRSFGASYPTTLPYSASAGTTMTLASNGDGMYCIDATDASGAQHFRMINGFRDPVSGTCAKASKQVTSGGYGTCSLEYDNNAYCWGFSNGGNGAGYLGNSLTTESHIPTAVTSSGALAGLSIKAVSSAMDHTCVIASDNKAYCWGTNYGRLGNNSTTATTAPVAVYTGGALSGLTVKSISAGEDHTCVIASDNNAYCWGYDNDGQLGDNGSTTKYVPTPLYTAGALSGLTIKAISAGDEYTCAIASNDKAYCWGGDLYGQMGNNATGAFIRVPTAVYTAGALSGLTIKAISAGGDYNNNWDDHACAIASDNNAYCWGYNGNGQLGDNTTTMRSAPTAVYTGGALSGLTINSISAGYYHTCALASNSMAYCWGFNGNGRLGDNTTTQRIVPTAVYTTGALSGLTIKSISAADDHTCAIASDLKAYCWGFNGNGRLGDNTTTDRYAPTAVLFQ